MTDTQIIMILGFAVTLISVMTPIIKLNTSITKLNATMENMEKQTARDHTILTSRVSEHGKEIDHLENRLTRVETLLGVDNDV